MTKTSKEKKLACICFSERGRGLAEGLLSRLEGWECVISSGYGQEKADLENWTEAGFLTADALLFVGAAGIAVRAIAPNLRSKMTDPAVVVMDEGGRYIIPLLSGHVGGANRLAIELAGRVDGVAVLTTATDVHGVFAVDEWAVNQSMTIGNPARIKTVSARLLRGETVSLFSWFPIQGDLPSGLISVDRAQDADICITPYGHMKALRLTPRCVAVGVGCRKGVAAEAVEKAVADALAAENLCAEAVCGVYSIDVKRKEPGILACCATHGWPFETYSAARLAEVNGSGSSSSFVMDVVGVDNVCERSALAEGGKLIRPKEARNGVTVALVLRDMTVNFGEA